MIELQFEHEKETKNTVRYAEVERDDGPPIVGNMYIQKFACKQLGGGAIPAKLTVTIQ